jgi:hypothetical protein
VSAAAIIRDLIAAGVEPDLVARVAQELVDAAKTPAVPDTLEKRRAYDRERKRGKRNSTGIPPESQDDNSTGIPPEFHRKTPPLARVEDNPLRVIPLEAATAVVVEPSVTLWPDGKAADWARALAEAAATSKLDPIREPGLTLSLGEIARWKDAGAHWEFDVLNVVVTLAKKQRDGPIRSWKFFTDAVLRSVADNRQALEIPEARHERHHSPSAKRSAREDNLERGFRVGLAAAGS